MSKTFLTEIPDEDFFEQKDDRDEFDIFAPEDFLPIVEEAVLPDIDISILDTDTEEEVEEESELVELLDTELRELRQRASALGVRGVANLNQGELESKIQVLLRVKAEGLSRLEFDENKELLPTLANLRILEIEAVQKKNTLTREDVLQKLKGYRLLTNKLGTTNRRWTRYIDVNDGFLRPGGFPIRNLPSEEFIVFKNVSKRFTFSAKRRNIILMEKLPKDALELIADRPTEIIIDYVNRHNPEGNRFVALKDDFSRVKGENNVSALARTLSVNRGALGRRFRVNDNRFKNYFIFRLSLGDENELRTQIRELDDTDLEVPDIPANLMAVIDRFYPERIDRTEIEEDEEKADILDDDDDDDSELSEEFDADDVLADLFEEALEDVLEDEDTDEEDDEEEDESSKIETIIFKLMFSILEDPEIDIRVKKLVEVIDFADIPSEFDKSNYIRILRTLKEKELLERDDGALLKTYRDRATKRKAKEEDERIMDIIRRGEVEGIAPINNPELKDVPLKDVIRLTFQLDRQEERQEEKEQDIIAEAPDKIRKIRKDVDEKGRPKLKRNSLEWWIIQVMPSGAVLSVNGVKDLLDLREDDIGKTFNKGSVSRSLNSLVKKRYVITLSKMFVKVDVAPRLQPIEEEENKNDEN